jgi:ubiquinol-cytochrome c reductase cytochrome b subunit
MGHPDNYIPANPLVTPPHIQPEWYFLFVYTILRSIPDKLLGVIAMLCAILVLFSLPFLHSCNIRSHQFRPLGKLSYWFFIGNFLILTYIGAVAPEEPFVTLGQLCSVFYFSYFLIITPLIGIIENKLLKLNL